MDLQLAGRVCIVTGASRGLGAAITRVLLAEGARVLGVGRTAQSCDAARRTLGPAQSVLLVPQDLRDPGAAQRLVGMATDRWGQLDILVNNAASFDYKPPESLAPADWHDLFGLKTVGYWSMMMAALPGLASSRGSVTNVAGIAALTPVPGAPVPAAVNAAVLSLTLSYSASLAASGVRVNAITPGAIDTDRFETRVRARMAGHAEDHATARRQLSAQIPVGYPADPDEVARLIAMVASPAMRSLTGANIVIDGGAAASIRKLS